MKFAYCRKNYRIRDFCIRIPVSMVYAGPFRRLSAELELKNGALLSDKQALLKLMVERR